jgi:hypothetical protein
MRGKLYRTTVSIIALALLIQLAAVAQTVWTAEPKEAVARPDMIYATGEGAVPDVKEQPNRAKAYLQAKTYAKMAAIASLAQEVRGTAISYCSTGKGCVADTRIKEEIKGVLDSIRVVSARKRPEGKNTIVEVTVRAPRPAPPKAAPAPKDPPAPKKPPVPSWLSGRDRNPGGHYTSLVIDAAGLGVMRSMSPRILRPDGSEVWGTLKVDPDVLSDYGVAAYVRSKSEAYANKRCGENPLLVRAIGRGPSATAADIVLRDDDASRLIDENRGAGFLEDLRVIIIVDRPRR